MNKLSISIVCIILLVIAVVAFGNNKIKMTNNSASLKLNFFAGGSINGNSFEVDISQGNIIYHEFNPDKNGLVKKIERELSPVELDNLLKTLADSNIFNLESQDFKIEPMIPDEGRYSVSVTFQDKTNNIQCSMDPSEGIGQRTKECQKQVEKLRNTLNEVLGVHMH